MSIERPLRALATTPPISPRVYCGNDRTTLVTNRTKSTFGSMDTFHHRLVTGRALCRPFPLESSARLEAPSAQEDWTLSWLTMERAN